MKVSIIIPFYNCPYIDQALESALNQTYSNIEIVLVNDGSTLHLDKLQPFRSRIKYIHQYNAGTGNALNAAIRNSTGEYVTWLSSDDVYYPNKVEDQLYYMLKYQVSFSFTNWDVIDAANNVIAASYGQRVNSKRELAESFLLGNPINGCTVMMSKEMLKISGVFDKSLRYTHDYDLWMRIMLAGYELSFIDKTLVKYRDHPQMGSRKHRTDIEHEIKALQTSYQSKLSQFIGTL
ncbi:glycosyltransferase family 2 protein [Paenibacillus psychroresistens]|uniref:glycosyltransferase family 2 protein n=1 Tax=Paenibacillus psychroresistens TaxID=1778678 RepID=UPI00139126C1|nr:glycosyltransferase family A protein [Paenibacillus psychroresistens]